MDIPETRTKFGFGAVFLLARVNTIRMQYK